MECGWINPHGITRKLVVLEVLVEMHDQHGAGHQYYHCQTVRTVFVRIQANYSLLSIVRAKHHLCKNYTTNSTISTRLFFSTITTNLIVYAGGVATRIDTDIDGGLVDCGGKMVGYGVEDGAGNG